MPVEPDAKAIPLREQMSSGGSVRVQRVLEPRREALSQKRNSGGRELDQAVACVGRRIAIRHLERDAVNLALPTCATQQLFERDSSLRRPMIDAVGLQDAEHARQLLEQRRQKVEGIADLCLDLTCLTQLERRAQTAALARPLGKQHGFHPESVERSAGIDLHEIHTEALSDYRNG